MTKCSKTKIAVAFITVIFSAALLSVFIFIKANNKPTAVEMQSAKSYDKAMLNVIENNLMQKVSEADYKNQDYRIDGYYFDGIRLYLKIKSTIECEDGFSIKTNGIEFVTDIFVSGNKEDPLLKDGEKFIVFNSVFSADLSDLMLCCNNQEICRFAVKDGFAKENLAEAYFEELQLNGVYFGKTSTLINCKISANIKGNFFQIMKDGEVHNVYILNRSENIFSLLIPLEMDKDTQFDLISNNENSAELRIAVDLACVDFK